MPDRKSALPFDFETIGKSVDRLPIRLLRQSGDRCRTLIFAGMHGEEPETTVAISRALRCLDSLPESCAVVP
ncbi:MAG: hypothetical protein HKN23_16595, partial [Verrucomicrobiales bacterium]|nr:hypothetical protein [Verrucomicrobiales bacterium]